jgi:hypothetical protein
MLISTSKPLCAEGGRLHIVLLKSRSGIIRSGFGNLFYDGWRYRFDVGGLAAKAARDREVALIGEASNLRGVSDIIGLYGAMDTGSAIIEDVKSA